MRKRLTHSQTANIANKKKVRRNVFLLTQNVKKEKENRVFTRRWSRNNVPATRADIRTQRSPQEFLSLPLRPNPKKQ